MMSTEVQLKHVFTFGDREVKSITLQRLKGKHIRSIGSTPTMDDLLNLASKSAGEPPALFDEMDAADVIAVTEAVAGFLGVSPQTGGNS